jgi:RHS repeat-associated protein
MGCLKLTYYQTTELKKISCRRVLTSVKSENNKRTGNIFGFNGKENDNEVKGKGNQQDYGMRIYDTRLSRFLSVDPMAEKMPSWFSYSYCFNNPINLIDPSGMIPYPVNAKFKGEVFRIDSWFGKRSTGLKYASTFHKGLDINFGGGKFDYGAPVLTTHTGIASIDDSPDGNKGRNVTVTAPDGSFRTKYLHLKAIDVKEGQNVTEANQIGEIGGSRSGEEFGGQVHLHYQIEKFDAINKKWEPYNPTEGNGNQKDNVVDPQTWIVPKKSESKLNFNFYPTMQQDNTRVDIVLPIVDVKKK